MPTIGVGGVELHYLDDGPTDVAAPEGTIVMLHGFARNGTFWNGYLPRLLPRFRVIRPDIRGCGGSPVPGGSQYEFVVEDVAADLAGLISALCPGPVHQVGESSGGAISAITAALYPHLFQSLTLISTPVTQLKSDLQSKSPEADSPEESLRRLGLKEWWMRSKALSNDLFNDERDETLAEEFARTPVHVAVAMWRAMHHPDLTLARYLPKVLAPTLVLSPTDSKTMSLDDQRALVDLLPNAQHQIHEANHGMYLVRADELATEIVKFVDQV